MLPESSITHICCCGAVLSREILLDAVWTCLKCNAKWKRTKDDIKLINFGQISCFDCYYHEFRVNKIITPEMQKEYIAGHCRHARALVGAV